MNWQYRQWWGWCRKARLQMNGAICSPVRAICYSVQKMAPAEWPAIGPPQPAGPRWTSWVSLPWPSERTRHALQIKKRKRKRPRHAIKMHACTTKCVIRWSFLPAWMCSEASGLLGSSSQLHSHSMRALSEQKSAQAGVSPWILSS